MSIVLDVVIEDSQLCYTWGTQKDKERRDRIRELIASKIEDFSKEYIKQMVSKYNSLEVKLYFYCKRLEQDLDNLVKLTLDALFYSARNEPGYNNWEHKIVSLEAKKFEAKGSKEKIEIKVIAWGKENS